MPGVPFRIGVMQLTMEPLEEILAHARALDRHGFDTIWLAEAYPWWRKHSMEARSSTAISALIARETERLTIGWGIISPFTRHPIQVAMDARVTQEAAGAGPLPARLRRLAHLHEGDRRRRRQAAEPDPRLGPDRPRRARRRARSTTTARRSARTCPRLAADAQTPRGAVPIYIAGTGPRMQEYAGEEADGLLTASITTPTFVRYSRENMAQGRGQDRTRSRRDRRRRARSSPRSTHDRAKGREGAREIAGMYLANKVQNIQGSADVLLELAGL